MINKIKDGDIITIKAIYFQLSDWRDSQPVLIISPMLKYTEASCIEDVIEDLCIDISCDEMIPISDEIKSINDNLKCVGTSYKQVRKRINNALKNDIKAYKNKFSETIECNIEFYEDRMDDELFLNFKIKNLKKI